MKTKFFLGIIIIVYIFCLQCIVSKYPPKLEKLTGPLPKYIINLDLPVKERYKDILFHYQNGVQIYAFMTAKSHFAYYLSKIASFFIQHDSLNLMDPEWIDYIHAVSEYCGITLHEALMLSMTYDMACTSVVVQGANNEIFMGRNLDFETYYIISRLLFEAEYYRNGEFVYRGIELVGFRGAINGVKPGKFAASINLRTEEGKDALMNSLNNISRIVFSKEKLYTPNFGLMKVMESAGNFEDAEKMMKEIKLTAAVHYILAGVKENEGVIISRNHDRLYIEDRLDVANGKWFIVICNEDLDKQESPENDYRRVPTEENIRRIGRSKISYDSLFDNVMTVYPTFHILTAYTSIQSPSHKGYFNTTVWLP